MAAFYPLTETRFRDISGEIAARRAGDYVALDGDPSDSPQALERKHL